MLARVPRGIFNLDAVIDGKGSGIHPSPSFGTITISDDTSDSKQVDLLVKLNNPNWKIQSILLNYDDSKFNNNYQFTYLDSGQW